MKFYFEQMLKVLAFYLEKRKKKSTSDFFLSCSRKQNKKALFTDTIFRNGFVEPNLNILNVQLYSAQRPEMNLYCTFLQLEFQSLLIKVISILLHWCLFFYSSVDFYFIDSCILLFRSQSCIGFPLTLFFMKSNFNFIALLFVLLFC